MRRLLLLAALALFAGPALAANNLVINDALGGFKVLACTESAGVCTLATTGGGGGGTSDIATVGSVAVPTSGADDVSNTQSGVPTYSRTLVYDGTTWDRWRGAVTGAAGVALALESGGNLAAIAASASTIATNTGTSATALGVIDDWDETDRAKVNPIVGQAGLDGGGGAVGANTLTTTEADDSPIIVRVEAVSAGIGSSSDDMEDNPADDASLIAFTRGILEAVDALRDATIAAYADTAPAVVVTPSDQITLTLTPYTSAITTGNVLAATQEVTGFFRVNSGRATLQNISAIDLADQGIEIELFFFGANQVLGTEGSAPDIDDTEVLDTICRPIRIGVSSESSPAYSPWVDLGANRVAGRTGIGCVMEPSSAVTSVWVAAIARGSATFTASSLILKFGVFQD